MELLILILAMFVRALFLQPKSSAATHHGLNQMLNRFLKDSSARLIVLFVVLLSIGYGVLILFGQYMIFLLETALFIYLYSFLHQDININLSSGVLDKSYLIEKLKNYDSQFEESDQSYDELAAQLYSIWLYRFFTSSLVLVFWYFCLGWVGLLIYSFVYYLRPNILPAWLLLLRQFLEIPAGLLGSLSCAIAGRMDAVIHALLAWKVTNLDNGRSLFEASVSASTDMDFSEVGFAKRFVSVKSLCLRSIYVWMFVTALILIV